MSKPILLSIYAIALMLSFFRALDGEFAHAAFLMIAAHHAYCLYEWNEKDKIKTEEDESL